MDCDLSQKAKITRQPIAVVSHPPCHRIQTRAATAQVMISDFAVKKAFTVHLEKRKKAPKFYLQLEFFSDTLEIALL